MPTISIADFGISDVAREDGILAVLTMPRDMDDTPRHCRRSNSQYPSRDYKLRAALRPKMLRLLRVSELRQRHMRGLAFATMPMPAAGELGVHYRGRGGVVSCGRKQVRSVPGSGRHP